VKKTTGKADTNDRPLLPKFNTIENRDAVLAYDAKIPRKDADGSFVTIWDGRSTKPHPVTGKEVPDESARTNLFDYTNPKRAEWPQADFIVGNPPFIGASRMRDALGDGYTETLRKAWKGAVPESADFVMYWWRKAAELLAAKKVKRFGFITTNSIHQTFNRRVLEPFLADEKKPVHLAYAIPDHPWVDSADGAAVRISMTVAEGGKGAGMLEEVVEEEARDDGENDVVLEGELGMVAANLRMGADISSAVPLNANKSLSSRGVSFIGSGFVVSRNHANKLKSSLSDPRWRLIRPFRNGRDLTQASRDAFAIDAFGLSAEELKKISPEIYQELLNGVKPERDAKAHTPDGAAYAKSWWIFGKARPDLRASLSGLERYAVTVMTGVHRWFMFLPEEILPDQGLIAFAFDDAAHLAVLSSSMHVTWTLSQGGTLEDRPRYNNSRCFETFPFPALEEGELKERIRGLGEKLDAHRKERQALHPGLTLTGMYNVLEKLRAGEPLSDKDRKIHDEGLVSILKQIHDDLDAAVFQAYGWEDLGRDRFPNGPYLAPLSTDKAESSEPSARYGRLGETVPAGRQDAAPPWEQQLLTRLVALNHERAAEEANGLVRWLRPEYQAPEEAKISRLKQEEIALEAEKSATAIAVIPTKLKWPPGLAAQVAEIKKLLPATVPDASTIAAVFGKKTKARINQIEEILETLRSLGKLD